jgi:flagellar L-ring protein precursor FlgH
MSARADQAVRPTRSLPANGYLQHWLWHRRNFEDQPRHVGDISPSWLIKNHQYRKTRERPRNGSASAVPGWILKLISGLISADLGAANASGKGVMSAKGGANSKNTFNSVTVTVGGVLLNSNLLVSGENRC